MSWTLMFLGCSSPDPEQCEAGTCEAGDDTDRPADSESCCGSETDTDEDTDSDTDSDVPDPIDPDATRVEVGFHELDVNGQPTVYVPISEGEQRTIEHGPQGGWHAEASAKLYNTTPQAFLTYEVHDVATGELLSQNQYAVALVSYEVDTTTGRTVGYYPNMLGFLEDLGALSVDGKDPPEILDGRTATLSVAVKDLDAREALGSVDVVLVCDTTPQDDCTTYGLR